MIINNHKLKVKMAAYDGCHKIYIPVKGQENLFIQSMEDKGYIFEEDFYKISSVEDLMNMYLDSCPLRFIEQIDFSSDEEKYISIIPQAAFFDEESFFDEDAARAVFIA
jgi:hypothetical protein